MAERAAFFRVDPKVAHGVPGLMNLSTAGLAWSRFFFTSVAVFSGHVHWQKFLGFLVGHRFHSVAISVPDCPRFVEVAN